MSTQNKVWNIRYTVQSQTGIAVGANALVTAASQNAAELVIKNDNPGKTVHINGITQEPNVIS